MASVFIVEDESITVLDLKRFLHDRGHVVVGSAKRGEDVLESVRRLSPDVIVMDIHLAGGMDGVTAAELVRKEFRTPILFLTADSIEDVSGRIMDLEPCMAMIKPYPIADLEAAIVGLLAPHT